MTLKLKNKDFSFRFLVLTIIERSSNSVSSTSQIIETAWRSDWVTSDERGSVESRKDSRIANSVNNITSHRSSPKNMLRRQLVVRTEMADGTPGLAITAKDKEWLANACEKLGIADHRDHGAVNEMLVRLRVLRE
jgi:hypothetical protein